MTTFEDRRKHFESKFANDQEMLFKLHSRAARIVGEWAAEKLGKAGDELEAYAKSVIHADLEEPGPEDVFRKLRADLPAGDISDDDIRVAMDSALSQAMDELGID